MRSSISVLVPALNEEQNLGPTLDKLLRVLPQHWQTFEILVYNDGSSDRTGDVANRYAKAHSFIKVFHHENPVSLGEVFRRGVQTAKYEFVITVHGQNAITETALKDIFSTENVDLVVPYQSNRNERPLMRRFLSSCFVTLLNLFFGLHLKYYNHYVLFRKDILDKINFRGLGYSFQAEILIKLIKSGHSWSHVAVKDDFSSKKKTSAFQLKNILRVSSFFFLTLWDVYT